MTKNGRRSGNNKSARCHHTTPWRCSGHRMPEIVWEKSLLRFPWSPLREVLANIASVQKNEQSSSCSFPSSLCPVACFSARSRSTTGLLPRQLRFGVRLRHHTAQPLKASNGFAQLPTIHYTYNTKKSSPNLIYNNYRPPRTAAHGGTVTCDWDHLSVVLSDPLKASIR